MARRSEPDVGEARRREGARERVRGAEVEEHRADLRRDPRVGDREDLGPAAVAPRTPDGRGRPAAGPEQPAHLAQRPDRVGHVHQPETAQRRRRSCRRRTAAPRRRRARSRRCPAPRSAATRRAASTISPEMSVPTTAPRRPTVSATRKLTSPVPQATSSTRSPGRRASHVEHQGVGRRELGAPAVLVGRGGSVPAVALHAALEPGVHGGHASSPFRRTDARRGIALPKTSR